MHWLALEKLNFNNRKISQVLEMNDFDIILLEAEQTERPIGPNGVRNLIKVDKNGEIIWIAEKPEAIWPYYYEVIVYDHMLMARTSGSLLFTIDWETGKVINYEFVK